MASTGICHICLKPHYQLSDSAEEIETKETTALGKVISGFQDLSFFVTQGTFVNISPNGRRKIIFKRTLGVGQVSYQEGMLHSVFCLGPTRFVTRLTGSCPQDGGGLETKKKA